MTVTIDEMCRLVALQLGLPEVAADDMILEDLGAESVDVMNIVAAVEDRYRITIDEGEIPDLRTAADLLARVRRGEAE